MSRGGPEPVALTGDFHVHSTFSDDAESTLAENLAAARVRGLREIRMVDHVRATSTYVAEFLAAVAALPKSDEIAVHTGVEAKMLDVTGRLDLPTGLDFGPGGVDRVLVADHQLPGPDGPWSPRRVREEMAAGLSSGDVLDMLVTGTLNAVHRVPRAQLAHPFSILPKIGLYESDLGDDRLVAWADGLAEADCLVEINEKWSCPGPLVIEALTSAGATIVTATDAHRSADVGRYHHVEALLAAAGDRTSR